MARYDYYGVGQRWLQSQCVAGLVALIRSDDSLEHYVYRDAWGKTSDHYPAARAWRAVPEVAEAVTEGLTRCDDEACLDCAAGAAGSP